MRAGGGAAWPGPTAVHDLEGLNWPGVAGPDSVNLKWCGERGQPDIGVQVHHLPVARNRDLGSEAISFGPAAWPAVAERVIAAPSAGEVRQLPWRSWPMPSCPRRPKQWPISGVAYVSSDPSLPDAHLLIGSAS